MYAWLTRGRRRSMREIREEAVKRGWQFRVRRWAGDPTAFRIDGRTDNGAGWILKTLGAGSQTSSPGWNAELHLRFPMLAGKEDFAILPREPSDRGNALFKSGLPPSAQARVTAFSSTLGGGIEFFQNAVEVPSGLPAFDGFYRVLVLPGQFRHLVDPDLAARILKWPQHAIAPHSVLLWRDPMGFHCKVRLPSPANWPTVSCSVALAEEFALRLPAGSMPLAPPGALDQLIGGL